MPMPMRRPDAVATFTVSLDLTDMPVLLVGGDLATAESLLAAGMPAIAVENATLPNGRRIRRTLADIAAAVAEAGVAGPTLTPIGDVVALAEAAPHVFRHAA
jgi:siroheme synthase